MKYRVTVEEKQFYSVVIEADSPEQAAMKAETNVDDWGEPSDGTEYEITGVYHYVPKVNLLKQRIE